MCRYCEVKKSKYDWDNCDLHGELICFSMYEDCKIVYKNDNYYINVIGRENHRSKPISFCPFCGRKLK